MRSPQSRRTRDGRPYIRMSLEDMSGCISAYIWYQQILEALPPDLSCVQVNGVVRLRRDGPVADIFGVFIIIGIMLNLTPGPGTVYILGRSMVREEFLRRFRPRNRSGVSGSQLGCGSRPFSISVWHRISHLRQEVFHGHHEIVP